MSANAEMQPNAATYLLRPLGDFDRDFSFKVYASTRADEMALVDWTEAQKQAFLWQQFNAQTEHYRLHYPQAEYFVIECAGAEIGRLLLERSAKQLLLMDLTLLPEFRCAGTGTIILKNLMAEAQRTNLPLVLRVEFFNPVIRLYTRLGFVKTREVNSVYHEMVWKPANSPA